MDNLKTTIKYKLCLLLKYYIYLYEIKCINSKDLIQYVAYIRCNHYFPPL